MQQRDEAAQNRTLAEVQLDEAEASYQAQETQLGADRSTLVAEHEVGEARITALRATIASQKPEIGALDQALALLDHDLLPVQRDLSHDQFAQEHQLNSVPKITLF